MNYRQRFESAAHFQDYLETTVKYTDLWRAIHARASVSATAVAEVEATGRRWHLLVISEDWCGDAVNIVPVIARFAEQSSNVDMRVLARDQHLDVMDLHLSATGGRSIPVVIVLDDEFNEVGWWGSRPTELQAWYDAGGGTLEKDARYRYLRGWYARDKGVSSIAEVARIIDLAGIH